MLTGDLVRVRVEKRELRPSLVDPDKPSLRERADELVERYRQAVAEGWTRGRLAEELDELTSDRVDHKLLRGLAKVLEDHASFEAEAAVPPLELRRRLFEAVGERPSREAARRAQAALAAELGLDEEALRRALFADRKAEQRAMGLDVPDGGWLLRRYNVALVQAVLLHCERLDVQLDQPRPERLQQLFRAIKFHGLMHRVQPRPGGYALSLDGPTSLLRLSTRYGLALANFFPHLLLCEGPWRLSGVVRWTRRKLRKDLALDDSLGLRSHLVDQGAYVTRTEQWFAERFEALDSGWRLSREGVVIDLGGRAVVCPDFTFRRDGRVAHLEIVGFWRRAWLASRLELLAARGPGNLVLAVSTRLEGAAQGAAGFAGPVVTFKEVVPAREVLAAVEASAIPEGSCPLPPEAP